MSPSVNQDGIIVDEPGVYAGPSELETITENHSRFKKPVISKKIIDYLTEKGYTLGDRLDIDENGNAEGNTSAVFLANYVSGDIRKSRVVKIPLDSINTDSITTIVNLSRGNRYKNEVRFAQHFSNELAHPNIVDVVDHFNVDGRDIIVENYIRNTRSLKRLIKYNYLNQNSIQEIFSQILDAFGHMHHHGVIYRDGKPSNFAVTDDYKVTTLDLQNCVKERFESNSPMFTKGGTPYSHPRVINAFMGKNDYWPKPEMDIHSLVVILYEMITGKQPFNYQLKMTDDPSANKIEVNSKVYTYGLLRNGKRVDSITDEMYAEDSKNAIKALKDKQKRFKKLF